MVIKIAVHVIIGTVVYTSEIKLPEDKLSIIQFPCRIANIEAKKGTHTIPGNTKDNERRYSNKQMTFSFVLFLHRTMYTSQLLKLKKR